QEPELDGAVGRNGLFEQNHIYEQFATLTTVENDVVFEIADRIFSQGPAEVAGGQHLAKVRVVEEGNAFDGDAGDIREAVEDDVFVAFDEDDTVHFQVGLVGNIGLIAGRIAGSALGNGEAIAGNFLRRFFGDDGRRSHAVDGALSENGGLGEQERKQ